jgi:hypothetical protein
MSKTKASLQLLKPLTASLLFVACGKIEKNNDLNVTTVNASGSGQDTIKSRYDVNRFPLNKLVCDPLDGSHQAPAEANLGLKAQLYTVPKGTSYRKVDEYIEKGTLSSQSLFFTDLNVPTRMFTEGFNNSLTNSAVKDDAGEKLIEYFGIRFTSNLRLPANLEEGEYELAVLSDDGAQVKVKIDNQWQLIVDNDGNHPTRMGCSSQLITFTRDTLLPVEISYYQGPRYHISNVLMWRKVSTAGADSQCGLLGNNMYFNPNSNSEPQTAYQNLLSRNWSVVPAESFVLDFEKDGDFNPCVTGTIPQISDFTVFEIMSANMVIGWKTDIPATSQIRVIEKNTGLEVLTASDNTMTTNHSMTLGGLKPNTEYILQAISVSADLGKAFSTQISESTLP